MVSLISVSNVVEVPSLVQFNFFFLTNFKTFRLTFETDRSSWFYYIFSIDINKSLCLAVQIAFPVVSAWTTGLLKQTIIDL